MGEIYLWQQMSLGKCRWTTSPVKDLEEQDFIARHPGEEDPAVVGVMLRTRHQEQAEAEPAK